MTKQEAKMLALEILRYYKTQPLMRRYKMALPDRLLNIIKMFHNYCPLCELFCQNPRDFKHCKGCPLIFPHCNDVNDEALQKNIKLIQAWEPEE